MIGLYTETPEFWNDICDEIKLFYKVRFIERLEHKDTMGEGKVLRHFFSVCDGKWICKVELWEEGNPLVSYGKDMPIPETKSTLELKKLKKRLVKQAMYEILQQHTGKQLPWGSFTGIRPTKLARETIAEMGEDEAKELFQKEFDISPKKIQLTFDIVRNQQPYIEILEKDIDIYIGIPFCVSRCKYCSFVSRDVDRGNLLKLEYLNCLIAEMQEFQSVLEPYSIRSIYIGGGTPTALDAEELDRLLWEVGNVFGKPVEYTVEAGRPDTVTAEKLHVLKKHGVKRISINAQTTKQATLELIGRKHTVQQFFDAFELARCVGFDCINTDVILGLPQETEADVKSTLEQVAALNPENITVHTLALKRSSAFVMEQQGNFHSAADIAGMVELSHGFMKNSGYLPYYLYKQKYMNGNLENTGYAKPGFACLYNIDHMEETTSIVAFGAGGISKRVFDREHRIERAPNVKDVEHYIARTGEMTARKKALFE